MTAAQSTARESGMALGRGAVPDYVRTVLADHGVLGCMVEWFARVDGPNAGDPYADPATYRKYALASVTTHDLPPATKLSAGEHANEHQHHHRTAADAEHAGQQADDHADNHQHHHAVRRFIQPTRIRPE